MQFKGQPATRKQHNTNGNKHLIIQNVSDVCRPNGTSVFYD